MVFFPDVVWNVYNLLSDNFHAFSRRTSRHHAIFLQFYKYRTFIRCCHWNNGFKQDRVIRTPAYSTASASMARRPTLTLVRVSKTRSTSKCTREWTVRIASILTCVAALSVTNVCWITALMDRCACVHPERNQVSLVEPFNLNVSVTSVIGF